MAEARSSLEVERTFIEGVRLEGWDQREHPGVVEFVEVSTPIPDASGTDAGRLELEMAGVVLRLPSDFDAAALDRVLGVLEARR